jgi:hypothetical protein
MNWNKEWDDGWKEHIINLVCNTAINTSWREVQEMFWKKERDKNPILEIKVNDK